MIMELMTGGQLFSTVVSNSGLTERRARGYFRDILLGLAYCHARGLAHRDIKLENLLLTGDRWVTTRQIRFVFAQGRSR